MLFVTLRGTQGDCGQCQVRNRRDVVKRLRADSRRGGGHRSAVQAATAQNVDGVHAPRPVPDGLLQQFPGSLDVLVIVGQANAALGVVLMVADDPLPAHRGSDTSSGRDLANVLIRRGVIILEVHRQAIGDVLFVEVNRRREFLQEVPQGRGEVEPVSVAPGIDGVDPGDVRGKAQSLFAFVPGRDREIAEQVLRCVFLPFVKGQADEFDIRGGGFVVDTQGTRQVCPAIEAAMESDPALWAFEQKGITGLPGCMGLTADNGRVAAVA
jgi:hypothetical protein